MIYFDNASTTSVRTEVRRVYGQMLETCYGNPDSLHAAGRQASSLMEKVDQTLLLCFMWIQVKLSLLRLQVNPIR